MARVTALAPDLLFGSRLVASLTDAGHEVTLAGDIASAAEHVGADVLVADLASSTIDPRLLLDSIDSAGANPRTLACFAHVEPAAREAALAAGFEVVVPRSRLAREAASLVAELLASARPQSDR